MLGRNVYSPRYVCKVATASKYFQEDLTLVVGLIALED
jgi:hypothetical protein